MADKSMEIFTEKRPFKLVLFAAKCLIAVWFLKIAQVVNLVSSNLVNIPQWFYLSEIYEN